MSVRRRKIATRVMSKPDTYKEVAKTSSRLSKYIRGIRWSSKEPTPESDA